MIVLDTLGIAYQTLPKAGCSTVKEMLAQIDPDWQGDAADKTDVDALHAAYVTRRFEKRRWRDCTAAWRFCVVRDPAARLLSVYTDRVLVKRDVWNSRIVRDGRPGLPSLSRDPDADTFFQNLAEYMTAASSIHHHSLPAQVYLGRHLGRYSAVFDVAQMDALAAELSHRAGKPVVAGRRNASAHRLTLADLAPKTIDAIRHYLNNEYEFLSEHYKNPLGPKLYGPCVMPVSDVS